jgi:hypothetical protein
MKARIKAKISQYFDTKDFEDIKLFCGLEITRDRVAHTITVGQE